MKDLVGKELHIGDMVAFSIPGYQALAIAHILRFGKKKVVLDVTTDFGCKVKPMSLATPYDKALCRYPEECVRIDIVG